jgi:hypothetical protein
MDKLDAVEKFRSEFVEPSAPEAWDKLHIMQAP